MPSSQRETSNAGGRDDPGRYSYAKRVSRLIYVALGTTGPHPYGAPRRIDRYAFHCGEVKDKSVIADTEACPVMAPTANRDRKSFLTREIHCSGHVHSVCT